MLATRFICARKYEHRDHRGEIRQRRKRELRSGEMDHRGEIRQRSAAVSTPVRPTQELVDLAVKEGFYPDAESAAQGVHPMLVNLVRSELIRELPNGTFAPPTMSQAIKLRMVG